MTQKKDKRSSKTKWTNQADIELKRIVDECPVLFLDEMKKELHKRLGLDFSVKDISVRLRIKLGYSRKLVYAKATQANARDREMFIDAMNLYITKPEMAIFIDESNKGQ